jgi:serine/threonine protein kinase
MRRGPGLSPAACSPARLPPFPLSCPRVQLIDFGSCGADAGLQSGYVQSRFYRAPEAILGLTVDGAVDVWSAGCVAAELVLGVPLFPGVDDADMMWRVCQTLGLPPSWMVKAGARGRRYFRELSATDERDRAPPQPPRPLFPTALLPLLRVIWRARKEARRRECRAAAAGVTGPATAASARLSGRARKAPSVPAAGPSQRVPSSRQAAALTGTADNPGPLDAGNLSSCKADPTDASVPTAAVQAAEAPQANAIVADAPPFLRKLLSVELASQHAAAAAGESGRFATAHRVNFAGASYESGVPEGGEGAVSNDALNAKQQAQRSVLRADAVLLQTAFARLPSQAAVAPGVPVPLPKFSSSATSQGTGGATVDTTRSPSPQNRRLAFLEHKQDRSVSSSDHAMRGGGGTRLRHFARTNSHRRMRLRSGSLSSRGGPLSNVVDATVATDAEAAERAVDPAAATPVSATLDALLLGIIAGDSYYHLNLASAAKPRALPQSHHAGAHAQHHAAAFGQVTPHLLVLPFRRPSRLLVVPGVTENPVREEDTAAGFMSVPTEAVVCPSHEDSMATGHAASVSRRTPLLRHDAASADVVSAVDADAEPRMTPVASLSSPSRDCKPSAMSPRAPVQTSAGASTETSKRVASRAASAAGATASGISAAPCVAAASAAVGVGPVSRDPVEQKRSMDNTRALKEHKLVPCDAASAATALAELQWRGTCGGVLPVRLTSAHTGFVCLREAADGTDFASTDPSVAVAVRLVVKKETGVPTQDPVYHPYTSLPALVLAAAAAGTARSNTRTHDSSPPVAAYAGGCRIEEEPAASHATRDRNAGDTGAICGSRWGDHPAGFDTSAAVGQQPASAAGSAAALISLLSKQRPDTATAITPPPLASTNVPPLPPDTDLTPAWVEDLLLATGSVPSPVDAVPAATALVSLKRTEALEWLEFIDFLLRCLALEPHKRITAAQALAHPFLQGTPAEREQAVQAASTPGGSPAHAANDVSAASMRLFRDFLPEIAKKDRKTWSTRRATSRANLRRLMSDREAERLITLPMLPPPPAAVESPQAPQSQQLPPAKPLIQGQAPAHSTRGGPAAPPQATATPVPDGPADGSLGSRGAPPWQRGGVFRFEESSVGRPASVMSGGDTVVNFGRLQAEALYSGGSGAPWPWSLPWPFYVPPPMGPGFPIPAAAAAATGGSGGDSHRPTSPPAPASASRRSPARPRIPWPRPATAHSLQQQPSLGGGGGGGTPAGWGGVSGGGGGLVPGMPAWPWPAGGLPSGLPAWPQLAATPPPPPPPPSTPGAVAGAAAYTHQQQMQPQMRTPPPPALGPSSAGDGSGQAHAGTRSMLKQQQLQQQQQLAYVAYMQQQRQQQQQQYHQEMVLQQMQQLQQQQQRLQQWQRQHRPPS